MARTTMERTNPIANTYDHKKDIQLNIQLNRWLLKPIGVWPKSAKVSWIEKFVYLLINVICIALISFLFFPSAIYMVLEVHETYRVLRLSGALSFCVMSMIKYFSLILRENDIRNGIQHIESDWMSIRHYKDQNIMIKNMKFSRRLVAICAFFMYGGAIFYFIALPLSFGKITEDEGNLTYRMLVNPVAKVIVDARRNPVNEIFFWMQFASGMLTHTISAGTASLAAVFAVHAYSRLEVLMQWIEHLVDGREDFCDNVDKRLAMIVQQHIRIIR